MTLALATLGCSGQSNQALEFGSGNIKVSVEQGSEWLHDFPLFWFIKKKNAPQIAMWIEDLDGNFLSTIYVSEKLAKQSWTAAGGNRRKESLPCWSYAQGKQYADGLYLPTKDEPLPDAVTGATPKGSFTTNIQMDEDIKLFVIKCEFNHSVDFNKFYPKDAKEGDSNYSGGKMGSGQPAIVYQVMVDLNNKQREFKGELIGHSSPDGSDGKVYSDTSQLTTALDIIKGITVYINQ
ncbi:hypothetical protein D0T60_13160 [Bacteroides sp. 224]|nr:hypothetical protein [Bacteroides sp. 224]NDV66182.1 hypothetical protein [Bacteroides sp. 224]